MVAAHHWCRVTLFGPDGARLAGWDMGAGRPPDLAAVDEVARIALLAARLGGRVVLTRVSDRMRELLGLAGLPIEVGEAADDGRVEGPAGEGAAGEGAAGEGAAGGGAAGGGAAGERSAVEVERQPELGEEPLRLQEGQEEAHPGDLSP